MNEPSRSTQATKPLPRLLTIEQVADTLGVNVRHVRRLVFERRIPYLKWGHLLRFDADEVRAWLADAHVDCQADPDVRSNCRWRGA